MPPAGGPPVDTPTITCSGGIGSSDPVAIVLLHSGTIVLRDYADAVHPRSVCIFADTPGNLGCVQLIDARHVVVPRNGSGYLYAVVDLPKVRYHWFQLPSPPNQLPTFLGVSPALDEVAWWSDDLPGNTDKVHLTTKAGDQVVASLPDPHGGRCGGPDDSRLAAFTRSGSHMFVLDNQDPALTSLLVLQGNQSRLLVSPPSPQWPVGAQPAMAVWSPRSETLYYRQQGDVWRWQPQRLPDRRRAQRQPSDDRKWAPQPPGLPQRDAALVQVGVSGHLRSGRQPAVDLRHCRRIGSISVIDQPFTVWPATSSNF